MSGLKKILIAVVVVIVLVVGGFVWLLVSMSGSMAEMNRVSKSLVMEMVNSNWDPNVIAKMAVPKYKDRIRSDFLNLDSFLKGLGRIKEYKGIRSLQETSSLSGGTLYSITLSVEFDAGPATISMVLVKRKKEYLLKGWKINVDAKTFKNINGERI